MTRGPRWRAVRTAGPEGKQTRTRLPGAPASADLSSMFMETHGPCGGVRIPSGEGNPTSARNVLQGPACGITAPPRPRLPEAADPEGWCLEDPVVVPGPCQVVPESWCPRNLRAKLCPSAALSSRVELRAHRERWVWNGCAPVPATLCSAG